MEEGKSPALHNFLERADTEFEQSLLRLLLGSASVLCVVLFSASHQAILIGYSIFLAFSSFMSFHIYFKPGKYIWRRIVGQIVDMSSISALLIIGGETAVVAYGVYLWVILGNGFRFGMHYLASSLVIGLIAFIVVVFNSRFFVQHKFVSAGLVLTQLIVPMYFSVLLRRLNSANEVLKEMSVRDPLTGLLNRRAFDRIMDAEFSRLSTDSGNSSLAVFDIDFFKNVNDSYGHAAGDAVIQCVAESITSNCRSVDIISRFGGEEFTILFPGMMIDEARIVGERIRSLVEESSTFFEGQEIKVTVSAGLVLWSERYGSVGAWFNSADKALYMAKQQGRNQLVAAG